MPDAGPVRFLDAAVESCPPAYLHKQKGICLGLVNSASLNTTTNNNTISTVHIFAISQEKAAAVGYTYSLLLLLCFPLALSLLLFSIVRCVCVSRLENIHRKESRVKGSKQAERAAVCFSTHRSRRKLYSTTSCFYTPCICYTEYYLGSGTQ